MELPDSYTTEQANLDSDARLLAALGVPLPEVDHLRSDILGDLDEAEKGIGWWRDHLDARRRVLIGDYLLVCCRSVMQNTLEAVLHLRAYKEARADFDALHERLVEQRSLQVPLYMPGSIKFGAPPKTPENDVIRELCTLHVAGLFRAVASAIDCLAAVVVGVEAVPIPILRVQLGGARRHLDESTDERLRAVGSWLTETIAVAGPPGWLSWVTDMRNMLVHRGRRVTYGTRTPHPTGLIAPDGRHHLRATFEEFLPSYPARSEIEAMTTSGLSGVVLPGEATANCEGVLRSIASFGRACGERLRRSWIERRSDPCRLRQPVEQWPSVQPVSKPEFRGYSDETFRADEASTSDELVRRMRAAALDNRERAEFWGQ